MKPGILVSISAALGFVLGGCQNNQPIYGKWEGSRDWKSIRATTEEMSRAFASVVLIIKADGSFQVIDGGMPFDGIWSRSGDKVNLNVTSVLGRPLEMQGEPIKQQATFSLRFDGEKMHFRNGLESIDIPLKKIATTGLPGS